MNVSQIAITTNEISRDPVTAVELGSSWGIQNYELKRVMGGRVPRVPEDEIKRIEQAVVEHGAKVVCVSPGLFINTLWGSGEAEEHRDRLLPESIAFAHRFGASKMIVFAGRRPEATNPAEPCPGSIIEELRGAAEAVHREGITLVLENMVTTWADTSVNTTDILNRVDHEAFQANWDPANAFVAGDINPYPEGYRLLADRVGHVHIKSAVSDSASPRGWRYTTMLDGEINWEGQIKALNERDYDGYLLIETHHTPLVKNSYTNLQQLKQVLSQLET